MIDLEKIINVIRLKRDDISWIGMDVKGTNLIVKINEADSAPEIIDKAKVCNIVADRSGIISSIVVHNGTARVKVGDMVEKGDFAKTVHLCGDFSVLVRQDRQQHVVVIVLRPAKHKTLYFQIHPCPPFSDRLGT